MADNVPITAGSGTNIATDDIGGVQYQRVKVSHGADGSATDTSAAAPFPTAVRATPAGYFPLYSGAETSASQAALIDPDGSLITRAAVLTDEGTMRCNFANTSIAVSIGSVTISGAVVTGTGFLAADVHRGDHFKLAADAETTWVQIASVDSDTQITLDATYTGGSSGTGNRSIMRPYTGSGGTISVASGQLTIASGTTSSAITGVSRFIDFAPLVFRARLSISQRIANQDIRIGIDEDVTTPRWFARFTATGTTNTTIIAETGRNPTGAPSASETEQTTVTLPNGATTASLLEYRIEFLTEFVRFFISDVLVAQHARVLPAQHDEMAVHVEVRNATSPASTTSVVVDYITAKNHNKLEVGIMSAAEQIVANPAPLAAYSYNVAGAITINTDLLIIDCSQLRGVFIQCIAMGTSGVVTPAFSNDGTTYVAATMITPAYASAATFAAAGQFYLPVMGRFLRLRLTTGASGGTTTINVQGTQQAPQLFLATQPVSGTVTANAGTGTLAVSLATNTPTLAAGTNLAADVGIQYRATATGAGTITNINCPATPAVQTIKGSAGRLLGIYLVNTNATIRWFKVFNIVSPTLASSTATLRIPLPQNQPVYIAFEGGMSFATAITCAVSATSSLTDATGAVTLDDVTGFTVHA